MITTGATKGNFEREYAVWDPRRMAEPLNRSKLDSNSYVMWTHLDEVSNLFFVVNKGSSKT